MPLLESKQISLHTQWGIWLTTESEDWLYSRLQFSMEEEKIFRSLRHPKRRLQWLSARVLLRTLLNVSDFIHLENDTVGKPVLLNFPHQVSMSHAGNQSAVMLSSKYNVGIDLEEMSDKIFAVAPRFLNQNEKNSIQTETARPHLYAYWCMKEALYKLYGKKGLDFSKNIFIHPFVFAMAGKCQAVIQKAGYEKNFSVSYRSTEKFMLAYVEDRQDFLHHNS